MTRRLGMACGLALVLALAAPGLAQAACTTEWLLGAANGSWSSAINWSAGVPDANDDVCIPAGSGTVTYDAGVGSVRSLQLARTLSMNAGSELTVTGTGATNVSRLASPAIVGGNSSAELTYGPGSTLEKLGADVAEVRVDVDFDGPVNLNQGTLSLGNGSDTVNHDTDPGAANGGDVTLANGTVFSIGTGGFGSHRFAGTVSDGAGSATVINNSGNGVSFNGPYSVHTTTNTGHMQWNGATSPEVVNLSGSNFDSLGGSADYTITEALNWSAGDFVGSGTTTVAASATVDFSTAGIKQLFRTLRNESSMVLDADGLTLRNSGVLDNLGGSTFTLVGDHDVGQSGGVSQFLVRAGATLVKAGAGESLLAPDVDLDGPVTIDAGTLSLVGDTVNHDTDPSAASSGDVTLADGTTFLIGATGFGTQRFAGTVTDGAGSATVSNSSGNLVTFSGPYSVHTTTNAGHMEWNGPTSPEVVNLSGNFRTLGGSASYTITEALNWSAGDFTGSGTTTLPAGATISFSTTGSKRVFRTLRNETTTFQPPADGSLTVSSPGRIDNAGTLTFPDDRDIGGSGSVRNLAGATLQKTAGAGGTTRSDLPLVDNAGTVAVAQGILRDVTNGYAQSAGETRVAAGTTLDLLGTFTQAGGITSGAGVIDGNLTAGGGSVKPGASPGNLTIVGNYTQGAGATLEVEIAGTTPGTGHDRLAVTGDATLDGTLAIVNDPAFAPDASDLFDVVTAAGMVSGQFADLTGETVSSGTYDDTYTTGPPGKVTLSLAAPPPPAAPSNAVAPSIPGSAQVGDTVTCDPGSWTGSPTFSFQWLRDGQPIAGATGQQYTITSAEAGAQIVCRVTATNAGGSNSADSNPLTAEAQAPPPPPAPAPAPAPAPSPAPPSPAPAPPAPAAPAETVRGEQAFTEGNANDLQLACTRLDLVLIDVLPAGRRVSVTGAADLRLAGRTAEILLDGRRVGRVRIGADGSFGKRVAAPKRSRLRDARYQARVGRTRSQRLELDRRMVATTLTRRGNNLILRGRISPPFARKPAPITVQRLRSCRRRERVPLTRRVVPDRRGNFRIELPVPTDAPAAIYRALTRVARRPGGRPTAPTFTLPRAIDLG